MEIANNIGDWWYSTEARVHFAPSSSGDEGADVIISSFIELLEDLLNNQSKIANHVNRATEKGCELSLNYTGIILHKISSLRQAYLFALKHMNEKTWQECCEMSIKTMQNVGIKSVSNFRTIQNYNISYRKQISSLTLTYGLR